MTQLLSVLMFSVFSHAAGPCVDLSGDFAASAARLPEKRFIFTLRQNQCDSISAGSYALVNGAPSEEKSPQLLYVNEAKRSLCPNCVGFAVVKDGIEIQANGKVAVRKAEYCSYNKVKWSLHGRNLVQTYTIVDKSAACRKGGSTFTRTLDRFR